MGADDCGPMSAGDGGQRGAAKSLRARSRLDHGQSDFAYALVEAFCGIEFFVFFAHFAQAFFQGGFGSAFFNGQ